MIMYPSLREMAGPLLTKMKGKIPQMKVIEKLIRRGASALSLPFAIETKTESSIKSALTSSATPTFLVMTFRFILPILLT